MKTVRDLRQEVLRRAGVKGDHTGFCSLSPEHALFWENIHKLGWSRRSSDPKDCTDIDETAVLTDEEWDRLLEQFDRINNLQAA